MFALPGTSSLTPRVARHAVRTSLTTWGVPDEAVDRAESITSELVTNSVRHTVSMTVVVHIAYDGRTATVGVSDAGNAAAGLTAQPAPLNAESGRGLWLIEALADRWYCRTAPNGGADVTAEIRVSHTRAEFAVRPHPEIT
ncbi:ATP-binding protein [Streptomyces yaizuensis]|nr:ATP-binding protein [Streptomyces sp. YSPA8]